MKKKEPPSQSLHQLLKLVRVWSSEGFGRVFRYSHNRLSDVDHTMVGVFRCSMCYLC